MINLVQIVNCAVDFVSINKVLLFIPIVGGLTLFTLLARSPIHSILSLIVTFLAVAVIFVMYLNLAFVGTLLVVIYVGAIAVLFLFVVMMIPMREKDALPASRIPWFVNVFMFTLLLGAFLVLFNQELLLHSFDGLNMDSFTAVDSSRAGEVISSQDLSLTGQVLYKRFSAHLVMCILLLFFALVIAIVLCEDRLITRSK